jgi:hypothetical protein
MPPSQRNLPRHILPVVALLLALAANTALLAYRAAIGRMQLRPRSDLRLSTHVLESGATFKQSYQRVIAKTLDTPGPFYATLRTLYAGRSLVLPSAGLFAEGMLKSAGGIAKVSYQAPLTDLSAAAQHRLWPRVSYSMLYNPYTYSPRGHMLKGKPPVAEPPFGPDEYPVLLLAVRPEAGRSGDVLALRAGRYLFLVPRELLGAAGG